MLCRNNDSWNIREEPDPTADEIIDKTLDKYTAEMTAVKLWSKINFGAYILCVMT